MEELDYENFCANGIGNYCGDLNMKTRDGEYFWNIENYDGHNWEEIPKHLYDEIYNWEKIPKSLYDEIYNFEKAKLES